jgi:hypothetical protein
LAQHLWRVRTEAVKRLKKRSIWVPGKKFDPRLDTVLRHVTVDGMEVVQTELFTTLER